MVYDVEKCKKEHFVDALLIASKSFQKFELNKFGCSFSPETILKLLEQSLTNPNLYGFVVKKGSKVVGICLLLISTSLYDSKISIIQDLGIQPNPSLSKSEQGKILIVMLNEIKKISKSMKCKLCHIQISPKFNISKFLEKNEFKLSDLVFILEVK
jgi:hypothetical protein